MECLQFQFVLSQTVIVKTDHIGDLQPPIISPAVLLSVVGNSWVQKLVRKGSQCCK